MPYQISDVYPWGRSFDEYVDMFSLESKELLGNILGCGDGPASFNCEANAKGISVTSCDPLYQFSTNTIRKRMNAVVEEIMQKNVIACKEDYDWDNYLFKTPEDLKKSRLQTMKKFIKDFSQNHIHHHYIAGSLPKLPFSNKQFTLALVGNLLFLYDSILDFDFHLKSIIELCRVADEVRIFPLTSTLAHESKHLKKICAVLIESGYQIKTIKTHYYFIKIASDILIVREK